MHFPMPLFPYKKGCSRLASIEFVYSLKELYESFLR